MCSWSDLVHFMRAIAMTKRVQGTFQVQDMGFSWRPRERKQVKVCPFAAWHAKTGLGDWFYEGDFPGRIYPAWFPVSCLAQSQIPRRKERMLTDLSSPAGLRSWEGSDGLPAPAGHQFGPQHPESLPEAGSCFRGVCAVSLPSPSPRPKETCPNKHKIPMLQLRNRA